jgi:hypothetical protein
MAGEPNYLAMERAAHKANDADQTVAMRAVPRPIELDPLRIAVT